MCSEASVDVTSSLITLFESKISEPLKPKSPIPERSLRLPGFALPKRNNTNMKIMLAFFI